MTSEPRRRISSLRTPTALSSLSPRKELLQTSSANRSVLWTAVGRDRPHLVEDDRHAERRRLPGCLAPGQTAANDANHVNRNSNVRTRQFAALMIGATTSARNVGNSFRRVVSSSERT